MYFAYLSKFTYFILVLVRARTLIGWPLPTGHDHHCVRMHWSALVSESDPWIASDWLTKRCRARPWCAPQQGSEATETRSASHTHHWEYDLPLESALEFGTLAWDSKGSFPLISALHTLILPLPPLPPFSTSLLSVSFVVSGSSLTIA